MVFGGPGTGKSTTLVESAVSHLRLDSDSSELLILAFGRERAAELRDKIVLRSSETTSEPLARTFHSLAFSILNEKLGPEDPQYVLVSGAEQDSFIRQLLATDTSITKIPWHPDLRLALSTRGFARELRDLLLRATESNFTYQELADQSRALNEPYWIGAAHFWRSYDQTMALRYGSVAETLLRIDPSAVITGAINRLKSDPALLERYRRRFPTIFVDEFQESDRSQRELLNLLAPAKILIFADPDSAVGSFRGADPDGVLNFASENNLTSLNLTTVFRSTQAISELGMEIAKHFRGLPITRNRASSTLPILDLGIDVARCENLSESAHYIAHAFRSAHLREGLSWAQMAVLVRSPGSLVSALQRAFAANSIPTTIDSQALAFSENPAIQPFLIMARIALGDISLDPSNWSVLEDLLRSEFCGADSISLRSIRIQFSHSRAEGDLRTVTAMMIDAITDPVTDLPWEQMIPLKRLHDLLSKVKSTIKINSGTLKIEDLFWAIWNNAVNYDGQALAQLWRQRALNGGPRGAQSDCDLDAMIQLFESARRFSERLPDSSPLAFLEQLSGEQILGDVITAQGGEANVVRILTVHSAKGMEWDLVALAGMQEGSWPNLRTRGSLLGSERLVEAQRSGLKVRDQIEAASASALVQDERRLLHVAITRARSGLVIVAHQEEESEPSSYFEEIFDFVHGETADKEVLNVRSRPLTSSALVSDLRRELTSENQFSKGLASGLLNNLANAGITSADPATWLGMVSISSDGPVVEVDQPIYVSPSNLQSFSECGLKWFLERSGGRDGASSAQLLGSAIHALAAQLAADPTLTDSILEARLRGAWGLIGTSQGWVKDQEFADAVSKLRKFYSWQQDVKNYRTLLAAEAVFSVTLGTVILRGSVDRLELTADGKIFIADLKTGAADVTKAEAVDHKQLGGYQLAIHEGGFSQIHPSTESAGAELVYLGTNSKKATIKNQPPMDPNFLKAEVQTAGIAMSGSSFIAQINKRCRTCGVISSCPIQSQGRSVIEP
jgi:superfamily I DNA/RNA helicase/RecB family exonuclease